MGIINLQISFYNKVNINFDIILYVKIKNNYNNKFDNSNNNKNNINIKMIKIIKIEDIIINDNKQV